MKHKGMFRLLSCLLAVVLCATAFSVTAFASGGDEYTEPPSEAQTEPTDEPTADIEFQIPEEYLAYLENIDLDALMDTLLSLLGGMGDVSEEETESGQIGTVTTNGSRLNVRIGAGLENRAFTQLDNGTTVDVLGTEGDWVMVLLPERVGYVHSDYLTIADKPADGGDGETPSISLDPDMLNELLSMFGGMFVGTEDTGGEALTPDGNMSLIDDIGSPREKRQAVHYRTDQKRQCVLSHYRPRRRRRVHDPLLEPGGRGRPYGAYGGRRGGKYTYRLFLYR